MFHSMRNNLSDSGKQNSDHVNIKEDRAVSIWTARFGCTKQQLEQAVKKVGSESGAVRAELGRKVPLRPQPAKSAPSP